MALNVAQIRDLGNQIAGRGLSDAEAQAVMNQTQGGDDALVRAYFQNDPQLLERKAREQADQLAARAKIDREQAIKDVIAMNQQAIAPAISSYEATLPEITDKANIMKSQLQAERAPLEERYANLLNQIKGNQTTAENRQTVATKQELARRGIQGGLMYDQELVNALNPITQQFTGLYTDTGLSQEQAIRQLVNDIQNVDVFETEQRRAVRNAIAELQAQAGLTGVTSGIGAGQFDTQVYANTLENAQTRNFTSEQNRLSREIQLKQLEQQANQAAAELALKQLTYQNVDLPKVQPAINYTNAQIQDLQSQIAKRSATGSSSDSSSKSMYKQAVSNLAFGGSTIGQLMAQFGGVLTPEEILTSYTKTSPYGPPKEDIYRQILKKSPYVPDNENLFP